MTSFAFDKIFASSHMQKKKIHLFYCVKAGCYVAEDEVQSAHYLLFLEERRSREIHSKENWVEKSTRERNEVEKSTRKRDEAQNPTPKEKQEDSARKKRWSNDFHSKDVFSAELHSKENLSIKIHSKEKYIDTEI